MARVVLKDATVTNVWADKFTGRDGDEVEYYRAGLTVLGEPPMEVAVSKNDFQEVQGLMESSGDFELEIDARAGRKTRVYLKGQA